MTLRVWLHEGHDGVEPASLEEIDLTIRLLACSRADLLAELEKAPEAALDWDPPYKRFAAWADWRTIRANLAHIANTETHYYTKNIGHEPLQAPAKPDGEWRVFLEQSRDEAIAFLESVKSSGIFRACGRATTALARSPGRFARRCDDS